MTSKDLLKAAVVEGNMEEVESIVCEEPRAVRNILGLMYAGDSAVRANCAKALVIASRYHERVVKRMIKSLAWAMDQRSGTYAPTAPEVLRAIAGENPELLLPIVPDLVRLAGDTSLSQGICDTLRVVTDQCPGQLGPRVAKDLERRMEYGEFCDIIDRKK